MANNIPSPYSGSGGGSGTVTSVTATDPSIVISGTAAAPTVATGTLDVIAADHPPVAPVNLNFQNLGQVGQLTVYDKLFCEGAFIWASIEAITSNYSINEVFDLTIACDATSGPFNVTLPLLSSAGGSPYFIKKIDATANAVTILTQSSDKIDGQSSWQLAAPYQGIMVLGDTTSANPGWRIIGAENNYTPGGTGTNGEVLTLAAGLPAWAAAPGLAPSGDTTGATDSANIAALFTLAGVALLQTGTFYLSGPIAPGAAGTLKGTAGMITGYWGDVGTVLKPGSSWSGSEIINIPDVSHANTAGPLIRDLAIDGSPLSSGTTHGISATGPIVEAYLENVTISKMTGWGIICNQDASAAGPQYPYEWHVRRMFVDSCKTGGISWVNMTDATWDDVYVLACGGGIAGTDSGTATGPGWSIGWSANTQLTNCRAEWSGTHGYHLTGAWPTTAGAGGLALVNCSTDRSNYNGMLIDATGNGPVLITGFQARRDGCNGSSGGGSYAGINVSSAGVPVIISGITVFPGINDDSSGTNSPEYGLSVASSNSVSVESGYIQAATTAINNGGGNSIFWVGPAVITATGTPASPGSYTNQTANSYETFDGTVYLEGQTATSPALELGAGTLLTTPAAGAVEYDGTAFYATAAASSRQAVNAEQFLCLSSAFTTAGGTTALQKLFNVPSAGAVTGQASTTYFFECMFSLSAMSATSGTVSFGFLGTATFTSLAYCATAAKATTSDQVTSAAAATATVITPATTTTTGVALVKGVLRINAAGTVIPAFATSVAAASVVGANSYFRLWPAGSNTVTTVGDWS